MTRKSDYATVMLVGLAGWPAIDDGGCHCMHAVATTKWEKPRALASKRIKPNGRAQFNTWPIEPFVNCVRIESVLQHRIHYHQLVIRSSLWYCVESGWSTQPPPSGNWTGINWQVKRPAKRLLSNWLIASCLSSSANIALSFLASRLFWLHSPCGLTIPWTGFAWWTGEQSQSGLWDIITQRQMNVSICISYLYSRVLTPTYTYVYMDIDNNKTNK